MAKKNFSFSKVEIGKNFPSGISTHMDWEPRTNTIEAGDLLLIEVELPGVNKEDVSIQLQENNELIIKGTKAQPRLDISQVTYHLFEREFGSFYKKIIIDFPLDMSNMNSIMENGVLTIKLQRKKPQKVSVVIEK